MRVQGADGLLGHLRALLSLSFKDLKGFFQTARRGIKQQHGALQPYQQTRYWSNVPFLHGELKRPIAAGYYTSEGKAFLDDVRSR